VPVTRALVGLLSLMAFAAPAAARERTTANMHGKRYCEYFVVRGQLPHLTADVWNTFGLNDCPERQWKASDTTALAKQLGALAVVLNGPRYWLIDSARISLPRGFGQVRKFPNGLRMRKLTTLDVPLEDGNLGAVPYIEATVNRANTFTWSRRFPVFQLVSPTGRVYVMQSFSRIVSSSLALKDLPRLGARLELPAGWHYRQRRLSHDLSLTTRGRATVLQDDLQDTYQLLTRG
jgi:haloalkane dehalogenase